MRKYVARLKCCNSAVILTLSVILEATKRKSISGLVLNCDLI